MIRALDLLNLLKRFAMKLKPTAAGMIENHSYAETSNANSCDQIDNIVAAFGDSGQQHQCVQEDQRKSNPSYCPCSVSPDHCRRAGQRGRLLFSLGDSSRDKWRQKFLKITGASVFCLTEAPLALAHWPRSERAALRRPPLEPSQKPPVSRR